MTRALIPLAEGCEEMEAVIVIDTLRRAGWEVIAAGFGEGPVRCSRGVCLVPDRAWQDVDAMDFDVLVLPGGGPGTERLRQDPGVLEAVLRMNDAGRTVAAICAAPLVLKDAGILSGRSVTSHPGVAEDLEVYDYAELEVVEDGPLVTSRGPGTAFAFALALIARYDGPERAAEIRRDLVLPAG